MEVYKLVKIIENQEIEIHLILYKLNEARDALRSSLKRTRDISIEENDTQCKEINTKKSFIEGNSSEFDAKIVNLMENNRAQAEGIKNLKLE